MGDGYFTMPEEEARQVAVHVAFSLGWAWGNNARLNGVADSEARKDEVRPPDSKGRYHGDHGALVALDPAAWDVGVERRVRRRVSRSIGTPSHGLR